LLTADQVEVRRRADQLYLKPLEEADRPRALALAEAYLGLARAHLGRERGQLLEACRQIPVAARDRRLAAGLLKLVLDRCQFEEAAGADPAAVRAALFTRAAAARRDRSTPGGFDRQAVIDQTAAALGLAPAALEQSLYADLPEAHRLAQLALPDQAEHLLAAHDAAGVQAVLLRAVRVRARVTDATPAAYRHLFRKLKFLRLLHQIEPLPPDRRGHSPGYQVIIDGPFSLFDLVTRYGLQLALAYPAIAGCGKFVLEADLRWGKERRPLRFIVRGQAAAGSSEPPPALPDDVEALRAALADRPGPWTVQVASQLVDLPGAGILVPDLELRHASGRRVLVEVLGFWSREAVWKRIELSARLKHPMIFAVSKHLRVSEAALPDDLPAALYVYARTMSAPQILEKAAALLARPAALDSGA
jgi:predicted nuclease of restriction endonuclease-like RecB superfamily